MLDNSVAFNFSKLELGKIWFWKYNFLISSINKLVVMSSSLKLGNNIIKNDSNNTSWSLKVSALSWLSSNL